jgi:hypothetical protein
MSQKIKVQKLASTFAAYLNCVKSGNKEWEERHWDAIETACENLPHGSGIDGKCEFQPENSTPEKLVFFFEFHHMDEHGGYNGWTEHNLTITPSLQFGYKLSISGRNKDDIKTYLYDLFNETFE